MLASDYFCAQSETSIRISRRTGSLRIVARGSLARSWKLSTPFIPTRTTGPWVSEEALRAVCEEKKEEEDSFKWQLVNSLVFGLIWYSNFPRHETIENISSPPLGHDANLSQGYNPAVYRRYPFLPLGDLRGAE